MGPTDRRAAWSVAVLFAFLAAAWVGASLAERDDAPTAAPGDGSPASGAREDLRPVRLAEAGSSATEHASSDRASGGTSGGRERRRERRHAEPADEPGARVVDARGADDLGIGPVGTDALAEEAARKGGETNLTNLRPPVSPAGAAGAKRVVARDWTPATGTFAAASGRRPNTAVARDRRPGDDPDEPLSDAALDVAKTHGLRGDYFDLLDGEITSIPDLAHAPPTFSRIDLALDFDTDDSFALPFTPDTFVVRWTGFLRAPEDAEYRFTVGSDDGARLSIDGQAVIDQPLLRAYAESAGAARLTAGLHAIEVVFYENYGYASCRLWWDGPSWRRRIVAPEFLTPPDALKDVTPPVVAAIDPPAAFVDDVVTIRGAGFSSEKSALRVTFRNVPAEIVAASPSLLTVKVPLGAATGDVVVRTGEISSLPRRFVVRNLLGLYSEYFQCSGELKDWPDFAHLAPYFVRLDPNLDFLEDNLWNLPYAPDVFASRHTGFLYAPEDDDYRLSLGSDDGARLTVDGTMCLDVPGLHPYDERTRTVRLAKGFHEIEVIFFENYGEARLALYWQRSGDATRTVVPEGFFYAPRELTDLPVPSVKSIEPAAAEIGGELVLRGTGFGSRERLVRVVFPGDVWARPASVDDEHVRVRVPYGAAPGELRVEVGIQASNGVAFTVATQQGLVADYFTFTDRAALEAAASPEALAKLTPSFTRVESGWQRLATKDWDLPFPATTFAVHWHGTLAVEFPTDVGWILRSAAGAWLDVDGRRADDCGPWHELEERYGGSHLDPGEHRFDLWFLQSGAEPRIQLLYTPVGRLDHLPVPGRWFLPREPRR